MSTQKLFGMRPFNNDTWDADREVSVSQATQNSITDGWVWKFILKNADDNASTITGSINMNVTITQYYEFRQRVPNPTLV